MICTEIVSYNNKNYIRTWSDLDMMIERDSILYQSAVDPVELDRVYTETDIPIPKEEDIEELMYKEVN